VNRMRMVAAVLSILGMFCHAYPVSAAEEALSAVVRIRSVFPADAVNTDTLGTERVGNGVVIDAEGTVLTLSFLTRDAEKIEVTGPDNATVAATVIGYDYNTGFSLLRTNKPLGIAPIKLGRSSSLEVGDRTIAVGAGGKRELQLTQVVSRKEYAGSWEYLLEDAIYTVPGFADFSGASLINSKGQLVGIGYLYTPIALGDYGLVSCNVFIPIDALTPILADLKSSGRSLKVKRPWLGIYAEEAHGRIFIARVTAGGPAEQAGLKPEDMIISVNGEIVRNLADFYRKVWRIGDAGVLVPLTVLKGDKIQEIKIPSADRYKEPRVKSNKEIKL
jgi:S1-C subfamily serine protease